MNTIPSLRSIAVVLLLLLSASAPAQLIAANRQEPSVDANELDAIEEFFGLTAEQNELIHAAWDGYSQAFQDTFKEYRDRNDVLRDEARETRDWETLRDELNESRAQHVMAIDSLEANFFDTTQSILTEEQAEQWNLYLREWGRRSRLQNGSGGGAERIDIILIVDSLELTEESHAGVADTLEQYAVEMDAALDEREVAINGLEGSRGDYSDPEVRLRIEKAVEVLESSRQLVRDINARYYETVINHLPEDRRDDFRLAYNSSAFPSVYAETPVDTYYETITQLETLTDEQRETIDGVYEQYSLRIADIRQRMVDMSLKAEASHGRGRGREAAPAGQQGLDSPPRIAPGGGGGGGGGARSIGQEIADGGDPRLNILKERHELLRETMQKLVAALDQEQLALAPAPVIHPFGSRLDDPHDPRPSRERESAPRTPGG